MIAPSAFPTTVPSGSGSGSDAGLATASAGLLSVIPEGPYSPLTPKAAPPPPRCALGTTFAASVAAAATGPVTAGQIIGVAQELGAEAIYLCAGPSGELLSDLSIELAQRRAELPCVAIDGALGAAHLGKPRAALASLAAIERDEAQAAVDVVKAALSLAQSLGAPQVVISLGPVAGLQPLWEEQRGRFLRGATFDDDAPGDRLMAARHALAVRHVDAARRSLDRLVEAALHHGARLLLRNPRRAIELPTAIELRTFLTDLRGAPLQPLLDLPAAHLASVMRLLPLRETLIAFGQGPLALLGDACGPVGGLPPGRGELDVAAVARLLEPETQRAFVPWPGLRRAEVEAGYRAVAQLLLGPARAG